VYFGTVDLPDSLVSSDQTDTSLTMTGLEGGTRYYWTVVAKDDHGLSTSGPVWAFVTIGMGIPCPGTPTVVYAGKVYNTVLIGTQCWFRENLDVGTMVLGSQNQTNNGSLEKYCYNNDTLNCNTYGGLYQWNEAMQYVATQGAQGICPPGWHLPTMAEFQALSNAVGGDGNALKAIGQGTGGGAGTNTSGFSALLAGWRYGDANFYDLGFWAYIWSSTPYTGPYAGSVNLNRSQASIELIGYSRAIGFSVRCLKN
jgi:uncharacterized protein (TIGR02145 family)